MSLLQFLIIISSLIFLIVGHDLYKRKKITIIHWIVFIGGGGLLIAFALNYELLNSFSRFFGIARGADLLVYSSIILLVRLFFGLYNKITKLENRITNLFRQQALASARGSIPPQTKLVLIMPCYKQDNTVIGLIRQIIEQGHGLVFVDDGYNGNLTSLIQHEFAGQPVVTITHPRNAGQGAALQTGQEYILQHVSCEFVGHFDADGQHQVSDIPQFLHALEADESLDIVLGSRFLEGSGAIPRWRKIHKKLQLLFTRIVIGIRLTDTHNGFRIMRRRTLQHLQITMNDYTHASEIEMLIKQHQLHFTEVPVHIIYHETGGGQPLSNARNIAKRVLYQLLFFK